MLCGGGRPFRHPGTGEADRLRSADSGAFRSGHVPKLKIAARSVALWHTSALEYDPEKWEPVFRKDHAQTTETWSIIQLRWITL
jgi:hypothetical protein